jgi:hypothetical protein
MSELIEPQHPEGSVRTMSNLANFAYRCTDLTKVLATANGCDGSSAAGSMYTFLGPSESI